MTNYSNNIESFRNRLLNIDFLNIKGKTFIKKLLLIIPKEILVDLILIKSLLRLKYIKCYNLNTLKIKFISICREYMYFSDLKCNHKIILRSFDYIIEYLKSNNIIELNLNLVKLNILIKISIKEAIIFTSDKWPLSSPERYYRHNYFSDKYLFISDKLIKNINTLQSTKYFLVRNPKIIKVIEEIEKFLTVDFLDIPKNDIYIRDWYACYQYLTLLKNGINHIYYSYDLNDVGQIENKIMFGLNPAYSELSKTLLGFGKAYLNETSILNLKKYICTSFRIDLNDFNFLMNINLDFTDSKNIEYLLRKYSLKSLILLLDWKENVLKNNYTEMAIELVYSGSGFQILSLISSDFNAMHHMGLIKTKNNSNIFDIILDKLHKALNLVNINWYKIVDINFIRIFMMTVFLNDKFNIQVKKLTEEYIKSYDLQDIFIRSDRKLLLDLIINSEIIFNDESIINRLNTLYNFINENRHIEFKPNASEYFNEQLYILKKLNFDIIENVKKHFLLKLVIILNEIIYQLYPNLLNFILNLKNLKGMLTSYYAFSLEGFTTCNEKIIKHEQFNLCRGMGDCFIMHTFIENLNIPIYFVDNVILCDVNHVELIQDFMLKAYQKVYDFWYFYLDFKYLNLVKKEKYKLNSLDIYEI